MTNTVIAHYPRTATGRALALGHQDRHAGSGGQLVEDDTTISIIITGYSGTEEEARAAFDGADEVQYSGLTSSKAGAKRRETAVGAGGATEWPQQEGVPLVASQREFDPRTPQELAASQPSAAPDQGGQPADASGLSPNMTGAGLAEARADRQALGLDDKAAAGKGRK